MTRSTSAPLRSILLALSWLLVWSYPDAAAAGRTKRRPLLHVYITASNANQFLFLEHTRDGNAYCRRSPLPLQTGIARSRQKGLFFETFQLLVSRIEADRALTARKKKREVRRLNRELRRLTQLCELRVTVKQTATFTATPTAAGTKSEGSISTPTPTPAPVVTVPPLTTPTATPTSTPVLPATATATPTPPPPPSKFIRAGTAGYGGKWTPDLDTSVLSLSGASFLYPSAPIPVDIAGTDDDPLYQTERYGADFTYNIPVQNFDYDIVLHFAEIFWSNPGQRTFSVIIEGETKILGLDIVAEAGGPYVALKKTVEKVSVADGQLNIRFLKGVDNAKVSAIEIHPRLPGNGSTFLHVVIDAPPYVVDYDGNGNEPYRLDGSASHTHEPGRSLQSYSWKEGAVALGNQITVAPVMSIGKHQVSLTIADDNQPPKTLTDSSVLAVYPATAVDGASYEYFPLPAGQQLTAFIDALPAHPQYWEFRSGMTIPAVVGKVGGSQLTGNVVVRLKGSIKVAAAGTFQLSVSGGVTSRLLLNGSAAPIVLQPGSYPFEAKVAIASLADLPAVVQLKKDGGPPAPIDADLVTHDETVIPPFINSMPSSGSAAGNQQLVLSGINFFPFADVKVNWGGTLLTPSSVTATSLIVTTPAGSVGSVNVSVQTPRGTSNQKSFTYTNSSNAPVQFNASSGAATLDQPTQAAWGPDGRLYVASLTGKIFVYNADDALNLSLAQTITALEGTSNNHLLGIAFNPFDSPSQFKIYVTHSKLFAQGGACYTGFLPYSGQVSTISAPAFSAAAPLVTGLSVSNHDHGVNGLQFDNQGDLYIAAGGNTNAGVAGACAIGQAGEGPLAAAILKAEITRPDFNGAVTYKNSSNGAANNDASFGESVDVASGSGLTVFAPGFRNPFDLLFGTNAMLYLNDNGPNIGFGLASVSMTTSAADPHGDDELVNAVEGNYYGHANRSRGRYDARQSKYWGPNSSPLLGTYTNQMRLMSPSTNGLDEYRATAFGGNLRGALIGKRYTGQGELFVTKVAPDGKTVTGTSVLSGTSNQPIQLSGLDVVTAPGGGLFVTDYTGGKLHTLKPVDSAAGAMQAYDIFPWRAPSTGNHTFVIGGVGFGSLSDTTVTIGGLQAAITSVSPTRIRGVVPGKPNPTPGLVDVTVSSKGLTSTIPAAFRYLMAPGTGKGSWGAGSVMPQALGSIAAGAINGLIYVFGQGQGGSTSNVYNVYTNTWSTTTVRPFAGGSHSAETTATKLYLLGGIGGTSEGKTQIFDVNSKTWTGGPAIPSTVCDPSTVKGPGAGATAIIGDYIYYAGGVIDTSNAQGGRTTECAFRLDTRSNSWIQIASMPLGRNRAAGGTDGTKFYVFGGRDGGTTITEGFADVQIYNPATNSWSIGPAPLPQKRGGLGKAAYYNGEFYLFGGESVPSGVDVYNPVTHSWRTETPLPTARHGIYPVVYDRKIYIAGGATQAGQSDSNKLELFWR